MTGDLPVSHETSQEDQEDVKALMKKLKAWKQVRDLYSKPWMSYYYLYRGRQWGTKRAKWKNSEIVNIIWQTIQASYPMQTDVRPKFTFLPMEPTDIPFAALIEKISDSDWDKWGWMQAVLEVILDGYVLGTGVSSMKWNQSLEYGIGAPVYKSEEPYYIIPDPDCNDVNDEDSEGLFHTYPVTTSKLKQEYPQFASKIKSDTKDWLKTKKTDIKTDSFYSIHQSSTMEMPEETLGGDSKADLLEKTLVIEAFLKPTDVSEEVSQGEGEQKLYTYKKKYPKGRHVVIACGMKLKDEELPYEDGLICYSKYINYCDSREFWGISEVEQLESPQRIFNRILCYAIDIMLYCSNPSWIVSTDADVDTDNMNNQPGQIIEKSPNGQVQRVPGDQLPPHFMNVLDRLYKWSADMGGMGEFSKGNAEGGVTAASAIEQLINAARQRIRQKQRNLDVYLKSVGRQYLNRILQYYTIPRIYRLTKDDGSPYWMKMSIEKQPDDSGDLETSAVIQSYWEGEGGKIEQSEIQRIYLRGELDIRVQAGSDLPFEAADKERKALALFDRGIIDAEEVLDQLQYPNKEKILMRMQEMQAQQQQAAMQQQQQAAMQQQGV